MKTSITITEFERLGGNISKVDVNKTFTVYGDYNNRKAIEKIVFETFNQYGDKLYNVLFNDGTTHRYSGDWIITEVEFTLPEKYK